MYINVRYNPSRIGLFVSRITENLMAWFVLNLGPWTRKNALELECIYFWNRSEIQARQTNYIFTVVKVAIEPLHNVNVETLFCSNKKWYKGIRRKRFINRLPTPLLVHSWIHNTHFPQTHKTRSRLPCSSFLKFSQTLDFFSPIPDPQFTISKA